MTSASVAQNQTHIHKNIWHCHYKNDSIRQPQHHVNRYLPKTDAEHGHAADPILICYSPCSSVLTIVRWCEASMTAERAGVAYQYKKHNLIDTDYLTLYNRLNIITPYKKY